MEKKMEATTLKQGIYWAYSRAQNSTLSRDYLLVPMASWFSLRELAGIFFFFACFGRLEGITGCTVGQQPWGGVMPSDLCGKFPIQATASHSDRLRCAGLQGF